MNPSYGNAVDPEKAAERAHVLLESEINSRLDAVRQLAKRLNDLDTAIAEYLSAWQVAQRAGWTDSTLSDIGLRAPESLPAPSGRRSADASDSAAAPAAPAIPSSPALAPVVALTPPPAPAPVVSAPAFGPAPTLGSVSSFPPTSSTPTSSTPASSTTTSSTPSAPAVVTTPSH
ncbi:hypothetical protein [Leifsonia shinshuensis]|uniref:Uncharacterized protein n=1 Tax=Leifsonia shinshuensis TaxID=150026 RepID=A0A853CQ24_9MICO|nr:hypothetical protein [Leifsonia shinshuensis]NYJ22532.1 hypothetical protein [Leifsonia shinshuensis]